MWKVVDLLQNNVFNIVTVHYLEMLWKPGSQSTLQLKTVTRKGNTIISTSVVGTVYTSSTDDMFTVQCISSSFGQHFDHHWGVWREGSICRSLFQKLKFFKLFFFQLQVKLERCACPSVTAYRNWIENIWQFHLHFFLIITFKLCLTLKNTMEKFDVQ